VTREEAIVLLECSATEAVGVLAATTEPSAAVQLQRYVDAYDMAISALREQSQWISVKERLPENYYQDVLVYDSRDNCLFIAVMTYKGEWIVPHYEDYEFNITHWMPLPEPPKENEQCTRHL
jgi:hypothetical protein